MHQACMFGDEGETLRDQGIQQAIDHAEEVVPNWSDLALEKVREFACTYQHLEFMAEDVRIWAHNNNLPEPPHKRAWGGVMVRAANKGYIQKIGTGQVKNPTAHCANATIWKFKNQESSS